jgi:hypothetical protein
MIGYVMQPTEPTELQVYTRVLEEHADERWAKDYLDKLIDTVLAGIQAGKQRRAEGWLD